MAYLERFSCSLNDEFGLLNVSLSVLAERLCVIDLPVGLHDQADHVLQLDPQVFQSIS